MTEDWITNMKRLKTELSFLRALIGVNLASAMEYRASFLSQIVGMVINDGIYFVFWLIFFNQFGTIRGYNTGEIYLLFSVVTFSFGLAHILAGNVGANLAYLIAQGRLDYYLVFPRNLLLHVVFSRMMTAAAGDLVFGMIAYLFTGLFHPLEILYFLAASVLAAFVFVAYGIIAGSLAFYMGNAQNASQQMWNAMVTFALYPNSLFAGVSRVLLFTLIPAGFVGAVPVRIVRERNPLLLLALLGAAMIAWGVATAVFYLGLRRYESGSAINVNV
jgi:ABC-2 type transport system permease protein